MLLKRYIDKSNRIRQTIDTIKCLITPTYYINIWTLHVTNPHQQPYIVIMQEYLSKCCYKCQCFIANLKMSKIKWDGAEGPTINNFYNIDNIDNRHNQDVTRQIVSKSDSLLTDENGSIEGKKKGDLKTWLSSERVNRCSTGDLKKRIFRWLGSKCNARYRYNLVVVIFKLKRDHIQCNQRYFVINPHQQP